MPYCHKPCYAALFGPQMMGYGSNVVSPANFKRENGNRTLHNGDYNIDPTMVFMSENSQSKPTNQIRHSANDEILKTRRNSSGVKTRETQRNSFDGKITEPQQKVVQNGNQSRSNGLNPNLSKQ